MSEHRASAGASVSATWLLRDNEVLAIAEIASSPSQRMRGLLGRSSYEGALILERTHGVHTIGMRFAIDVAFLDKEMRVISVRRLRPWRVTLPRIRSAGVLEAQAGAFDRWRLCAGDVLELRPAK